MAVIPIDTTPPTFENAQQELDYLRGAYQEYQGLKKDVARVCGAVARGDLTQKIEEGQLKDVVNTMVDNLGLLADEVKKVSFEVGTEGKHHGKAQVPNAEGAWREITDAINDFASNHALLIQDIQKVAKGVAQGDLTQRIELDVQGGTLDLKNTVNDMAVRLQVLALEVARVSLEVGSQGKLGGQARVPDVEGVWFELVRNVNRMCLNITDEIRSVANVSTALSRGDFTQKMGASFDGEMNTLKGAFLFCPLKPPS
ncbi:hypothetical protein DXG01_002182 [Tephrocybe rancida]|nr:hypothetical protein DXG01_002182 [Tephrocybe rancida]